MKAPTKTPATAPCRWLRRLTGVLAVVAILVLGVTGSPASAASRIKDIADFEGVRNNLLVGYGLVVGLNGTGDDIDNATFTRQSLVAMLERLGVNTRGTDIDTDNVAAVMISAQLPAFSHQGTTIDVTVSALGDAESLLGGTLLVTPLMGADGEVYAVAQGNLVVSGFSVTGDAATVTKGVPTSGRIPNGAIVEREVAFELNSLKKLHISLRNPDFTTARRVAQSINAYFGGPLARPIDPGTIEFTVPPDSPFDVVNLLTDIEQLVVETDQVALVVVEEQSGVIVMDNDVRVDTVAIAQGNLTIRVTETAQVSQPQPFSTTGATVTVPRTEIEIDEGADRGLAIVERGVSLQDLVDGLNALGVSPRDMISILQTIKAAGALQAELVVM